MKRKESMRVDWEFRGMKHQAVNLKMTFKWLSPPDPVQPKVRLVPSVYFPDVLDLGVEEMESDGEEAVAMVTIGKQQIPFNEVTEEMIAKMTPVEKEAYIKLGQEMYEDLYD
jgi:hypothetical protein